MEHIMTTYLWMRGDLTVDITDVLSARHTTTNPARASHFLHQVVRVLDILGEQGNLRGVLLVKELLRDRATLLAQTHLLRVKESALNIRVTTTITHERHSHVRARLGTDIALVAIEDRLVTEKRICINLGIVNAEAFARIDIELGHGHWIYAGCFRHQVSSHIVTGADTLGVEGLQAACVIAGVRQSIKSKTGRHSSPGLQNITYGFCGFFSFRQ